MERRERGGLIRPEMSNEDIVHLHKKDFMRFIERHRLENVNDYNGAWLLQRGFVSIEDLIYWKDKDGKPKKMGLTSFVNYLLQGKHFFHVVWLHEVTEQIWHVNDYKEVLKYVAMHARTKDIKKLNSDTTFPALVDTAIEKYKEALLDLGENFGNKIRSRSWLRAGPSFAYSLSQLYSKKSPQGRSADNFFGFLEDNASEAVSNAHVFAITYATKAFARHPSIPSRKWMSAVDANAEVFLLSNASHVFDILGAFAKLRLRPKKFIAVMSAKIEMNDLRYDSNDSLANSQDMSYEPDSRIVDVTEVEAKRGPSGVNSIHGMLYVDMESNAERRLYELEMNKLKADVKEKRNALSRQSNLGLCFKRIFASPYRGRNANYVDAADFLQVVGWYPDDELLARNLHMVFNSYSTFAPERNMDIHDRVSVLCALATSSALITQDKVGTENVTENRKLFMETVDFHWNMVMSILAEPASESKHELPASYDRPVMQRFRNRLSQHLASSRGDFSASTKFDQELIHKSLLSMGRIILTRHAMGAPLRHQPDSLLFKDIDLAAIEEDRRERENLVVSGEIQNLISARHEVIDIFEELGIKMLSQVDPRTGHIWSDASIATRPNPQSDEVKSLHGLVYPGFLMLDCANPQYRFAVDLVPESRLVTDPNTGDADVCALLKTKLVATAYHEWRLHYITIKQWESLGTREKRTEYARSLVMDYFLKINT